uniref:Secreted protein n=1 Tax=Attheya septentrionalis TaxID=420275 RepID=A0A7S2U7Q6_9STRA
MTRAVTMMVIAATKVAAGPTIAAADIPLSPDLVDSPSSPTILACTPTYQFGSLVLKGYSSSGSFVMCCTRKVPVGVRSPPFCMKDASSHHAPLVPTSSTSELMEIFLKYLSKGSEITKDSCQRHKDDGHCHVSQGTGMLSATCRSPRAVQRS